MFRESPITIHNRLLELGVDIGSPLLLLPVLALLFSFLKEAAFCLFSIFPETSWLLDSHLFNIWYLGSVMVISTLCIFDNHCEGSYCQGSAHQRLLFLLFACCLCFWFAVFASFCLFPLSTEERATFLGGRVRFVWLRLGDPIEVGALKGVMQTPGESSHVFGHTVDGRNPFAPPKKPWNDSILL